MRSTLFSLVTLSGFLAWMPACNEAPAEVPVGALSAGLRLPNVQNDVTAVRIDVVASDAECGAAPLASKSLTFDYPAPAAAGAPAGAGAHAFTDGLFVLGAGTYRACATPLAGDDASQDCAPAQGLATVVAGETHHVLLVSQCKGQPNGGLDVGVALNSPPQLTGLAIAPSKFITVCQSAQITATAIDPDGDALTFGWSILEGPAGGRLTGSSSSARFSAAVAGSYVVGLTVDDALGARTTLSFPVHVADAVCAVPEAVQAIFSQSCSPCHTVNASGGLKLDTAVASYANLVGRAVGGVGCTDRVRVVAGDPAASYLLAKLRGLPGICGAPMPRGRPSLPEAELQTLESWIVGLPH